MSEAPSVSSADSTVLWVTYLNIVLYALSYQLQRPVEPFLIQSLTEKAEDADAVRRMYGNLQSFFQTIQTLGSPLVGILLDRLGIRYTSAIVFGASALSYAILSVAYDIPTLFWSKIPTVLQAAFLVAQATAATSTGNNASARAAALGRMTTAYTVGATLGPALGGYLADQGDFYIGSKLAVAGSLLSVILSLVFLPNVVSNDAPISPSDEKKEQAITENISNGKRSIMDDLWNSGELVIRSALWPLLMLKVVGGVVASIHSTALPLVLTQDLGFDPSQLGFSMSASMMVVSIFAAVGMAPLTNWLGPPRMTHSGLIGRALLGFTMAAVVATATTNSERVLVQIVVVSIFHALASHVLATGLTTQTTGAVANDEQGTLLGLEHSLFSMARIGGPTIGTMLLFYGHRLWAVELVCSSIDILLLVAVVVAVGVTTKWKSN